MPPNSRTHVNLLKNVAEVFDDAQSSVVTHSKNCAKLYKIHSSLASDLLGEQAFEEAFFQQVLKVLPIKKGIQPANHIVQFVSRYVEFLQEKTKNQPAELEDAADTMASRFTEKLLDILSKGYDAADKSIRFRCIQFISKMCGHLGDVDEDILDFVVKKSKERLLDKESCIRAAACVCLSEMAEEDPAIMPMLIAILPADSAVEVRRTLTSTIPITPDSLTAFLARTHDSDPTVRKQVYVRLKENKAPDQLSPYSFSAEHRTLIILRGLKDRESSVSDAARSLLEAWFEVLTSVKDEDGVGQSGAEMLHGLTRIFEMFDRGGEGALVALNTLFEDKRYHPAVDGVLDNLTPATAFIIRVFSDYCIEAKHANAKDEIIPTVLATEIGQRYQELTNISQANEDAIFILAELLRLAVHLDYSDELGRKKMLSLICTMLSSNALPGDLVTVCLDVLRVVALDERDLVRIMIEIVYDLCELGELVQEQPMELRNVLRCLVLCRGTLERVQGTLDENRPLEGIMKALIAPSVRSTDVLIKKEALISYGLCCLLSEEMALSSYSFFEKYLKNTEEIQTVAIKILCDIFTQYHRHTRQGNFTRTLNILCDLLDGNNLPPTSLTCLCVGMAKLVLHNLVSDTTQLDMILCNLAILYFSPTTADNLELCQSLSDFFPKYSLSQAHQKVLVDNFTRIFIRLANSRFQFDGDESMVPASIITSMFVHWTDPRRLLTPNPHAEVSHIQMGTAIMKVLLDRKVSGSWPKEEKRGLCQSLVNLYLPDKVDDLQIRQLDICVDNVLIHNPFRDASTLKLVAKFSDRLKKQYGPQLEPLSQEELSKFEELRELFDFLDDLIPSDDDENSDTVGRTQRKRKSDARINLTDSEEDHKPPVLRSARKLETKRQRLSIGVDDGSDSRPPAHTSQRKKRRVTKSPSVITISDSDDDKDTTPRYRDGQLPQKGRILSAGRNVPIIVVSSDDSEDEENEVQGLVFWG